MCAPLEDSKPILTLSLLKTKVVQASRNKRYMFSNRRMANNYADSVVLGHANVNKSYKLSMDSSSDSRRKKRRIFNKTNEQHLRDPNNRYDQHQTVVAYGYASLSGTFEKQNPIPVKKIRRVIAQRALVIPVDEYNTSQKCCHSLQQTRNINYSEISYMQQPRLQCKLTCLENLVIFIIGSFQNVYPLKLFQHCQQEGSPCIWNRDVNASCNIKTLLTRYIRSGFALDSRYPQLTRTRQEGH
ncbi:uncharacterized protein EV154DRAFT_524993 [Mucor mucedo]|uniref:uncharacterized protein n=1 Tax=Mucor mucedo TaxID=29922 RepID=UPI002220E58C|nr:uncharacterized protein EV154DRAFT_524993 [Mucor mucedo]KAI7878538.1 hypothetical protein EV154DRAFT_524993 [Mucor mucedo]